MAILFDLTGAAREWLEELPEPCRSIAQRLPPNRLYRLASNGHRVTIVSYSEDGTVWVVVSGKYNLIDFAREVFGVDPNGLTECDLPAEGEPLGVILEDSKDILEYLKPLRRAIAERN